MTHETPKIGIFNLVYLLPWLDGSVGWNILPYTKRLGIPNQDTNVGCGFDHRLEHVWSQSSDVSFSLPHSFPLSFKRKKSMKNIGCQVRIENKPRGLTQEEVNPWIVKGRQGVAVG